MALQRRAGGDDKDVGMEGSEQAELLAMLVLAGIGGADPGKIGILAKKTGRGSLAAGIGIHAGIQHHDLDRRIGDQDARQRAEADVIGGAVAADGHHGRHKAEFLHRKLVPLQVAQDRFMLLRLIGVIQFQPCHAQGPHVAGGVRRNAFEDALGQRLGVLEQAVHPWIVVAVEREAGGVDAAAAG